MPTTTYIALANTTLTSSAGTVTFSSIPATYRDLVLVCRFGGTNAAGGLTFQLRLNGDTGNNYSDVVLGASGGGVFSNATVNTNGLRLSYAGDNGTAISTVVANIMDYSATNKHKTVITRHSGTADSTRRDSFMGRWANNAAITSITIRPDANSIASGSTFALYGIVS